MSGAVADPIWPEPESAPEPRTSGVAKKSGRSRSASSSIWTRSGSRGKSNKPNFKRFITKFSQMLNKIWRNWSQQSALYFFLSSFTFDPWLSLYIRYVPIVPEPVPKEHPTCGSGSRTSSKYIYIYIYTYIYWSMRIRIRNTGGNTKKRRGEEIERDENRTKCRERRDRVE